MKRKNFKSGNLSLSYLNSESKGQPLIALHGHFQEGISFASLAAALNPEWHLIALDQRGHGNSEHATTYTRDDYLNDLLALIEHLKLNEPVVILGSSLGGLNAYQFASQHPELVRALIIEDIGVEIAGDLRFLLAWGGVFKTREELEERIGPRFLPYVKNSLRHDTQGWRLAFNPEDLVKSMNSVVGDYWQDWLASSCPTLLIRGQDSNITTETHLREMATRRPNTEFCTIEGGHILHIDNPIEYTQLVKKFLSTLNN